MDASEWDLYLVPAKPAGDLVGLYSFEGVAFALPQGRKFRHALEVGVEAHCPGLSLRDLSFDKNKGFSV